jgi:hypothetical protein
MGREGSESRLQADRTSLTRVNAELRTDESRHRWTMNACLACHRSAAERSLHLVGRQTNLILGEGVHGTPYQDLQWQHPDAGLLQLNDNQVHAHATTSGSSRSSSRQAA